MPNLNFKSIHRRIGKLLSETKGQDLVEYALLSGFMVVAIWAFFPTGVVPSISTIFSRIVSTANTTP